MKRLIALAALAAVTSLAVPPVMAQTLTGSSAIVMNDHSMRASKLVGLSVTDEQGHKLGTIVDVLVKGAAVEPTVILSTGQKMVAAPLSHLTVTGTKLMMPGTTPAAIAAMPTYGFNPLEGGGG